MILTLKVGMLGNPLMLPHLNQRKATFHYWLPRFCPIGHNDFSIWLLTPCLPLTHVVPVTVIFPLFLRYPRAFAYAVPWAEHPSLISRWLSPSSQAFCLFLWSHHLNCSLPCCAMATRLLPPYHTTCLVHLFIICKIPAGMGQGSLVRPCLQSIK
jgi:hypothetical protein